MVCAEQGISSTNPVTITSWCIYSNECIAISLYVTCIVVNKEIEYYGYKNL